VVGVTPLSDAVSLTPLYVPVPTGSVADGAPAVGFVADGPDNPVVPGPPGVVVEAAPPAVDDVVPPGDPGVPGPD
jgi:hypothetical protein